MAFLFDFILFHLIRSILIYFSRYGLGQVYELLKQGGYALHYYRKAAALRPYDARMWTALGACYKVCFDCRDFV